MQQVRRFQDHVEIYTASGGLEVYDAVFIACHSDQALQMLADPTPSETAVLSAIEYQPNVAILHTDERVLPKRRRAWAAWNYHLPERDRQHVAVTYNMNILQGIEAKSQYLVTLNDDTAIEPGRVIRRVHYEHPIFSLDSVAAQARQREINVNRTFFCGAYWRHGFHEDGVVSALDALRHFEEKEASGQLHLRRAG